jgi:glycosyltransferase involved in cell wall biosynthesis
LQYLPQPVRPTGERAHLVICYKNFAAHKHISHIGLGVTALTNARILNAAGYWTEVWPIVSALDLNTRLQQSLAATTAQGQAPVSHVVISAPWIPTADLLQACMSWHGVQFSVVSHSNVGFLQADPNGVTLLREAGDLQTSTINCHIGANNQKLVDWWQSVYRTPMRCLPNLYDLSSVTETVPQRWSPGKILRIGSFGATRPLKNILTAGAAALEIAARVQADLEFNVSSGRAEGGGDTITRALMALYANLPTAKVVQSGWQSWPAFRRVVRSMSLLIQPSYTESFCMVVADALAEGVPSVTSEAIDWVPSRWQADSDDADDIATVGVHLLHNPQAVHLGLAALKKHNAAGLQAWSSMLTTPSRPAG